MAKKKTTSVRIFAADLAAFRQLCWQRKMKAAEMIHHLLTKWEPITISLREAIQLCDRHRVR